MKKSQVLLMAPLFDFTGYGVHARQLFRALHEREDIDLYIKPISISGATWLLNNDLSNGIVEKLIEIGKKEIPEEFFPDVTFQLCLPSDWNNTLGMVNVGVSAWVEADMAPGFWLEKAGQMDHIIFPSSFCKDSLKRTFEDAKEKNILSNFGYVDEEEVNKVLDGKVNIIPEAFPDSYVGENKSENLFSEIDTDFNFLTVSTITDFNSNLDRKNLFTLVRSFCDTFKNNPYVGLVVKTQIMKNTSVDFHQTKALFESMLSEFKQGEVFPKVYLLHGVMNDKEMHSLYTHPKIKAYLSLTRGEGFGLPLLEAAACDLPVMVTNWSGHLDFLKPKSFLPLDYELINVPALKLDGKVFAEGARWANPDYKSASKKMKKLYENYDKPKEWAIELGKNIRETHNFKNIQKDYNKFFDKIF